MDAAEEGLSKVKAICISFSSLQPPQEASLSKITHEIVEDAARGAKAVEEAALLLSAGVRDEEADVEVRAVDADAVLGEGGPEVRGVRRRHAEEPGVGAEQGGAALASAVRQEQTLGERVSAVLDDANRHLLERPTF